MTEKSSNFEFQSSKVTGSIPDVRILLFVLLFLGSPGFVVAQVDTATPASKLEPDSAKECAICHYSWVDTFFVEHRGTELAALPEKPTAADAEMCFSCHDGSTVDSRKQVFNDRMHQVGVKPSEKISVPEIFPLDEEGKMDCATCHSAHGVSTEPGIEKTIFLRTSNENSQMCTMCHEGQVGGPEKGHHPVDETTLEVSEKIILYGGYTGSKPNQVICESCHVAHGGFSDKRLVLPVDRPAVYPVLCEQCHGKAPGLSEHKNRNRFSHSVDVKPEKAEIPKNWQNGREIRLGSQGELICVSCHATHEAPVPESLLLDQNKQDSACLQCHASQEKLISGTKHDLREMAPDAKNIRGETVSQSGPCSSCHLMHEGIGPFMWARWWEGQEETAIGICKSCHAEGKSAEEVLIPETGHPVGVKPEDETEVMDFPLFTATGKKSSKGFIYCSSCHNSHQWDPLNPQNKGSKDDQGDITNSFLRTAHEGSNLCLGCHKKQAAIEKTDHDLAVTAPQEKNIRDQLPQESGVCGSCHLAHGGADIYMWSRQIPQGEEALMTKLCVDCHSKGSCAEEKLTGEFSHPIDEKLKENTENTLPLYSAEGRKEPDGKVFCSTCHDPHQWNPRDPQDKAEEGTAADSFLRLTSADSAPLCKACHEDQSTVIGTDHDLTITAPAEQNSQGVSPDQSGVCGACHAVHNAQTDEFLWNRALGPSVVENWNEEFTLPNNTMIGVCTSCHVEGDCAADKVPDYGLHPDRIYMALLQEKAGSMNAEEYEEYLERFPIYTDEGEKSVEGNIVCSTCHDVHLWDARRPGKVPGKEIEGNATNSFLRRNISFSFCASCHGEDALFMFKYFHIHKGRIKLEQVDEEEQ